MINTNEYHLLPKQEIIASNTLQQYSFRNGLMYIHQPMSNQWTFGIFNCLDNLCISCEICMCHWCHISRQYNMIKYNKPEINYKFCCFIFLLDLLVFPCIGTFFSNIKIRSILQQKYEIENTNFYSDIIYSALLPLCTVCQHYKQMTTKNNCPGSLCLAQSRFMI
jgi:Cys-rich protein (TIGR01571 family)